MYSKRRGFCPLTSNKDEFDAFGYIYRFFNLPDNSHLILSQYILSAKCYGRTAHRIETKKLVYKLRAVNEKVNFILHLFGVRITKINRRTLLKKIQNHVT